MVLFEHSAYLFNLVRIQIDPPGELLPY
jgi:hypothetical protein